jgi:hypothetical protein
MRTLHSQSSFPSIHLPLHHIYPRPSGAPGDRPDPPVSDQRASVDDCVYRFPRAGGCPAVFRQLPSQ